MFCAWWEIDIPAPLILVVVVGSLPIGEGVGVFFFLFSSLSIYQYIDQLTLSSCMYFDVVKEKVNVVVRNKLLSYIKFFPLATRQSAT